MRGGFSAAFSCLCSQIMMCGISSHICPSRTRPRSFFALPLPPHCLKKNGMSNSTHRSRTGRTHSACIGLAFGPLSPATIERVPWSGQLLCVWNDHGGLHAFPKGKRTPLCAALSDDEGQTWSPSRILEPDPDGWYCYTAMTFLEDRVLLAYCAGDSKVGGLNRMKVISLSRSWFE